MWNEWAFVLIPTVCLDVEKWWKYKYVFYFLEKKSKRKKLTHLPMFSGILIKSSGPVTVQCASINELSSEAFLALPVEALGCRHQVMTYVYKNSPIAHEQGPALIGLVAAYDNTSISITLPNGTLSITNVTLDRYQTYQVRLSYKIKEALLWYARHKMYEQDIWMSFTMT